MNITVNSAVLAQEVRLLAKIAASKPTIPILGHILLHAEDSLRLSATDLELAMTCECKAMISEMGEITLPAKALLDILERLPDSEVTITDKGIASGSFRSRIGSLPAEDFPTLPSPEGDPEKLSASVLRSLIDRTSYAISDKEQKYVLKGALLSLSGEVAAMVSTDGRRLSIVTANRKGGNDVLVILPVKALGAITDQPPIGEVAFTKTDRHIFFDFGKRVLISRTIDGEFPKYQRVIPKNNEHIVQADRVGLAATLRRTGLAGEAVVAEITPGSLAISARSAEFGETAETLPVKYDGPIIKICFNWKNVLDFLEHAVDPTVSIALKDGSTPLLLKDGTDFINVVMVVKG